LRPSRALPPKAFGLPWPTQIALAVALRGVPQGLAVLGAGLLPVAANSPVGWLVMLAAIVLLVRRGALCPWG